MSSSFRTQLLYLLRNDTDQIRQKKTIRLNGVLQPGSSIYDFMDILVEFLDSVQPPLELERLILKNNYISEIPNAYAVHFRNLKYLDLHDNDLYFFPEFVNRLYNLEILDLSSNNLNNISSELLGLKNLRVISLKDNQFNYLPPYIGELQNLNLIEVSGNPLVLPSFEMITNLQRQGSDLEWVNLLKSYLQNNASLLQTKLNDQMESKKENSQHPSTIQPLLARSKSVSDTKTKASKAARRMGLIIKKPDNIRSDLALQENPEIGKDTFSLNYGSPLKMPNSASAAEISFNNNSPPNASTTTATTVPNSQGGSPPLTPLIISSNSSSNLSTLSRPSSSNRSRSNTLKEIDRILEKNDIVDTEHKSGAYFRRLSTLQEIPSDENSSLRSRSLSNNPPLANSIPTVPRQSSTTQKARNIKEQQAMDEEPTIKSPPPLISADRQTEYISPIRNNYVSKKQSHDSTTIIRVSRKILFSFSELHSSVRRFTGFCSDKKITIKMVSFLYSTKSNIDSLVENLEIMEESGNNMDQILECLGSCCSSFKSIMNLLSENFSKFVLKIDVCFIRMLYLTLYGSFNELSNAYRLLDPSRAQVSNIPSTSQPISNIASGLDPKQKLVTSSNVNNDFEDVDEKLYKSIELATTNAHVVFSELTNAISRSAIASATTVGSKPAISHAVATKVKELTTVCMSSMDITKRLQTKLVTIRNNPSYTTRRSFWDDINLFLKAIIQTFSAVKGIMKDLPILNDIRASMATLTKATKDVTIMLEVSSYRSMSVDNNNPSNHPSQFGLMPSASNIFTPLSAHPSLQCSSTSSANLNQLYNSSNIHSNNVSIGRTGVNAGNGAVPNLENLQHEYSNNIFNTVAIGGANIAPFTAPVNSSGQYFEKNGVNPFDGLILANKNAENENT